MAAAVDGVARTNLLFRAANERIRARAEFHGVMGDAVPFLCECARRDCFRIVRVGLDLYREVRAHPRRFIQSQHGDVGALDGIVLVVEGPGYVVVEATGDLGDQVEALEEMGEDLPPSPLA